MLREKLLIITTVQFQLMMLQHQKKSDNLTKSYSKSNGGSEFDDNDLQEAFQQPYSQ